MKKLITILSIFLLAFLFIQCQEEPPTEADLLRLDKASGYDPVPNPDPGQDPDAPVPNLSFPVITYDYIPYFYEPDTIYVPDSLTGSGEPFYYIEWLPKDAVIEVINTKYGGTYPEMYGFYYGYYVWGDNPATTDVTEEYYRKLVPYLDFLKANVPWYPQFDNTWQAEWVHALDGEITYIDFIDWGNPMENTNPIVGYRFPIEIAFYTKFGGYIEENVYIGETMTAYRMACLEYQSSRGELFGTSEMKDITIGGYTWQSYYATVVTTQFVAYVVNPYGVREDIVLEPAVGPSGKMNFASAGGGWIPKVAGEHTVYFRILDPDIKFTAETIINDDESYWMAQGIHASDINWKKQSRTDIYCTETSLKFMVVTPSGGGGRKM